MINFAQVTNVRIPEGNVIQITDSENRILWKKNSDTPGTSTVKLSFTSKEDTTVKVYYSESTYNSSTPDLTISLTANQKKTTDTGQEQIYKFSFASAESITEAGITGTVLTCKELFSGCMYLSMVDLTNVDTSKVTDMSYMFNNCYSLSALDLSKLDTSNVTTMRSMFTAVWIQTLDLSSWNTNKVEDMSYMFYFASNLTTIGKVDTATGWQHKPSNYRNMFDRYSQISPKPSWFS